MLDPLTFLVGKVFVLSHFNLFRLISSSEETRKHASQVSHLSLKRGDLLEVPRTLFIHFGIYLGDNRVAHLMPDILPALTGDRWRIQRVVSNKRLLLGVITKTASIRVDSVEDFAYGSPVLVNAMDRTPGWRALPAEEVALRAERLLGAVAYSLLWDNCEHFVTHCRYGCAVSWQTQRFCESLKSAVRDQRSVLCATLMGIFCMVCLGFAPSTTLPSILIPFTLWMAS